MGGVFISYRRADSAAYARSLAEALSRHFGADQVFFDRDGIEAGARFPAAIQQALDSCQVLLALIGPGWLKSQDDESGRRRLDDSKDFVRKEIATALRRPGVVVIPILLNNASMPPASHLPKPLAQLADCNARPLSDESWRDQIQGLITDLEMRVPPLAVATPAVARGPVGEAAAHRAKLEITQKLLGEVLEVRPLTRAELSWLLWGKPNDDPSEPGADRRRTAERLAVVNPDVRQHLASALSLVPYCDSTSSDVVGPSARRVGLLSATIRIEVKIRNSGTESSGIRLKRPAQDPIVCEYPAESGRALAYSILEIDDTRKDVVAGTPVMVRASLRVQIWFDGWAKYDPFGYVRVARDLADCLSHPIDFVRLTGVLDDGDEVATDLVVKIISEQSQRIRD